MNSAVKNTAASRAGRTLLLWALFSSAAAQTAATQQGTYTLSVPAGARTLVISRGTAALTFTALPAGSRPVPIKLTVSAARYSDTVSQASTSKDGKARQTTTRLVGPFNVSPVKGGTLRPALNTWALLWSGERPGTSSFSFTLGGKSMKGSESDQAFKVRVLFSKKTPDQLKTQSRLRPPQVP